MLELDGGNLTYEAFAELCLKTNRPAIVRSTDKQIGAGFFSRDALREALSPGSLQQRLGPDLKVVVECNGICEEVPLSSVFTQWAAGDLKYLKDFHFQQVNEENSGPGANDPLYRVPEYLGRDWMQEFVDGVKKKSVDGPGFGDGKHDYRFAYIGPPGTQTLLHFDVFGTYSWSYNVSGEKRWYFPTPTSNKWLLDSIPYGLPLPPDLRVVSDIEPLIEVVQRPSDLVFVPACYLHQTHNLKGEAFLIPEHLMKRELVVSVNHNWCNEFNIETMVDVLKKDVQRTRSHVTDDDLVALYGETNDGDEALMDRFMRSSSNWNVASMRAFMQCCSASSRSENVRLRLKELESTL